MPGLKYDQVTILIQAKEKIKYMYQVIRGGQDMFFRVYCSKKEIEAPDIETARKILVNSLEEVVWLLPVTDTPFAPPAREPKKIEVKEKKLGTGSMTLRH